jgi:Ca-activated chloride channel family protein
VTRAWPLLFSALFACTPYVPELEHPEAVVEQGTAELEDTWEPWADDDREDPVEPAPDGALRCWEDVRPSEAGELEDPAGVLEAGVMAAQREGKWLSLPLQHTSFDTVVVGTVAATEVVQTFANPFAEPIEVVYVFPLPERAAVDHYQLAVGDRLIRGEMQTREQALARYEEAKHDGHIAGLLEQERPNIFTQHLANIPPGESIEVSLHLVNTLEQDEGTYSLVLPTVVGRRYNPKGVSDASRITPPRIPDGFTTCADLDVRVAIEPGLRPRALRSSFHAIDIQREGDVAVVELDGDAGPVVADRDFILTWELGVEAPQAAIVAQPDTDGDGGTFTLTVQPPRVVADEQAVPRELVFVVDTSGSMSGDPLKTAKAVMHEALAGMRPDDSFAITRFSSSSSSFDAELTSATPGNIEAARAYVDEMVADGGTEMLAGVGTALGFPHEPDRLRVVLFLTDGLIGNETEVFRYLDTQVGDARLFALGVGTSPNRFLLDGLARVGRGAVAYVGRQDEIDEVVERFYSRIATPVLTDIEVDWQGLAISEVVPARIPDLFAGQPLTLFGRYAGEPAGDIVIRGRARGRELEVPVRFEMARSEELVGVSSVWARRHIDELLGYPAIRSPHDLGYADAKRTAIELALAHGVMTEFTSFVAVDEQGSVAGGQPRTIVQPVLMPAAGQPFQSRGSRVPQVRHARAQVIEPLSAEAIRNVVQASEQAVRRCYNRALERDRTIAGRVAINFVISSTGKVISSIVQETNTDWELGNCVAWVMRRLSFPAAPGAGRYFVTYPFNFHVRPYERPYGEFEPH